MVRGLETQDRKEPKEKVSLYDLLNYKIWQYVEEWFDFLLLIFKEQRELMGRITTSNIWSAYYESATLFILSNSILIANLWDI